MTIYYLYVKTHNITGLKYLGKTTQDPYVYQGSGKNWKPHIKEHGYNVATKIIKECYTKEELNHWGRYYSELWDIVKSPIWANKIPETGGGSCSSETAEKISKKLKGVKKPPRTKEHIEKISSKTKGMLKPRTNEHQLALTESIKRNWENNYNRKVKTAEIGKSNKGRKQTPITLEKRRQAMIEYWKLKKSKSV